MKKVIIPLIIVISMFSTGIAAYADDRVEIFDIRHEQVIKSIEVNKAIKKEALKLIDGITGMYMKFRPLPESGYMIGIPIEPAEKLYGKWCSCTMKKVIIMIPEKGELILGVFDDKQKLLFFYTGVNADGLLKKLEFSLPLSG